MPRVEARIEVDEVVGMFVADHDAVDVGEGDVALEVRQRSGARVDPQVEPVVLHEIAARRGAGVGPRAARAEDDELHVTTSTTPIAVERTPPSSGPRKWCEMRRNISGSPVVRNSCRNSPWPRRSRFDETSAAD